MQDKKLHIISFDNPFPPFYGGVIDVFYKIKALHTIGVKIHLHCFVDKIPESCIELNSITEKVYFYKSSKNPFLFFSRIPFSVISRNNKELLKNLNRDVAPILFENLKTTFLVNRDSLPEHKKVLRLQNIEQDYFLGISKTEQSIIRKISYYFESLKYKVFEENIIKFDKVFSISKFEDEYISSKFHNSVYIPVFHGNTEVIPLTDFGEYTLYHGDLKTADNKEVVRFLVSVFKDIPTAKLVIASGTNQKFVSQLIAKQPNIHFELISNFEHLQQLLNKAHINISWSFQKSGTKLKLINSLFNSRFSIINENIVDDELISNLCFLVKTKQELVLKIQEVTIMPYNDFTNRKNILENYLNDIKNAGLIMDLIDTL